MEGSIEGLKEGSKEGAKKRIFSGIKPTGSLMLGHYIGALRNWALLQMQFECIYCVVDLHALTIRIHPETLRTHTLDNIALYIACGLSPERNLIFVQSHVPQHAELTWILNCFTYVGELSRMTQFKEKSRQHADNINAGLYDYPVLMASDILLYDADLVPVGEDQKQHIELARDVAMRMNKLYPGLFVIPDPYISKVGARIMDLLDPTIKMSKSDETGGSLLLLDPPDVIRKKMRRSVTDLLGVVRASAEQPGITNLLNIMASLTGKQLPEIETDFEGKGYGAFKDAVADVVIERLKAVQAEYYRIRGDEAYLQGILRHGAEAASAIAEQTLKRVYDAVGLIPR